MLRNLEPNALGWENESIRIVETRWRIHVQGQSVHYLGSVLIQETPEHSTHVVTEGPSTEFQSPWGCLEIVNTQESESRQILEGKQRQF